MHNAPAVSFPVGRSRFQGWFLSAAWLAGAAACAYWASVMDGMGWRHGLALAVPLGAGAVAWAAWARCQRPVGGMLHWDGQCWRLEAPVRGSTLSLAGNMAVHLDFQSFLLLSLRPETGGLHWLWIDQCAGLAQWQAFRRAVHSKAAGHLRAADPPAANAVATGRLPPQKAKA